MDYAGEDLAQWFPDVETRGLAVPVRVGVNSTTGKVLIGWGHVQQSLDALFACRFHERVLRRWLGSFVPHLLGENITQETVLRYFSAISTAIDLWEPCYAIEYVNVCDSLGNITRLSSVINDAKLGKLRFRTDGLYMPRGHLGDFTVEGRRAVIFTGLGSGVIERVPA